MRALALVALLAALPVTVSAETAATRQSPAADQALAKDLLRRLVEIDTREAAGTTAAAQLVAARLRDAGFAAADVQLVGKVPHKQNLVARLRGKPGGKKPILLLAHLDVVEADAKDWTVPPFVFTEKDGWFYGRGTTDNKDEAAIWTTCFIRWKREGYVPDRDLILALTADEENGPDNGVKWLVHERRALIDAAFGLNEGGGGVLDGGRRLANNVQASEKVYQSYSLETTNRGGHSSLPRADNAIVQLSAALGRLAQAPFPVQLNEVTRAYFERTAATVAPDVDADMRALLRTPPDAAAVTRLAATPTFGARLRTTCVPTQIEGGHAENALPQRARAVVNCRILPGEAPDSVRAALVRAVADPGVTITALADAKPSPPSPLTPELLGAIEKTTAEMWPGVPVIPTMGTGATDGLYLRQAGIPVYGASGIFGDAEDVRAHGQDERIHPTWLYEGLEFSYRLVTRLTGGKVE